LRLVGDLDGVIGTAELRRPAEVSVRIERVVLLVEDELGRVVESPDPEEEREQENRANEDDVALNARPLIEQSPMGSRRRICLLGHIRR
jgi:hypothetical protein